MLNPASTDHKTAPAGHVAFLRRVTTDEQFRLALEADPEAAFAEYGLHVDSEQLPSEVRIPSAESILDALIDAEDEDDSSRTRKPVWWGFLSS